MAGRITTQYEILNRIGCGGTAEVFRAIDRELGRTVALKRFHAGLFDDVSRAARVRAEVDLARSLTHRGIAAVYDLVIEGGDAAIAMEYLPGGDLRRRILLAGALPPGDASTIIRALLEALAYAHERGVVHRDLKPRNVLFAGDGSARIADFGLARSTSAAGLHERGSIAGTAEYIAPESITASLWDARTDLYALGCTLFEMLTGRPPYVANTPDEVLRLQVEAPIPDLPPEIGRAEPALAVLCTALLAKDPNERPQSAREAIGIAGEESASSHAIFDAAARARRDAGDLTRCPSCGGSISARYPWCFTCGRAVLPVSGARRGSTVIVAGPGRVGDKLDAALRDRCVALCGELGITPGSLAKTVPRVPFVLARRLERGGAHRVAERLAGEGIESIVVGPGDDRPGRARRLILRKALVMSPRIYLIAAASSGGLVQFIFRGPTGLIAAAAVGILIGVPIVSGFVYRSAVAKVGGGTSAVPLEVAELLLTVDDPLVHARVRTVVESAASLERAVASDESVSREFAESARAVLHSTVRRAAALGVALDRLRDGERIAHHSRLLAAGSAEAEASAALVRDIDRRYTRTLEQIGAAALTINEMRVRLARAVGRVSQREVRELSATIERLADAVGAWNEIERELGSA